MQGMEYEQQVIGAYCGVLGEEGEEGEDASHATCHAKKNKVDPP